MIAERGRIRAVIPCLLAGALALHGCGSSEDAAKSPKPTSTPARTATPPPSAALPSGLRGGWKRRMTARDWRPVGGGYPVGTWRFEIDGNGEVDVYQPGIAAVDFSTRFVVKGRDLTIDGVPICPGQTGRYTWRASADRLKLTVVADDACEPRAVLFGGPWTRRR